MNNGVTSSKPDACSNLARLGNLSVQDEKYEFIRINDYFSTPKWRVPPLSFTGWSH